MIPDPKLENKLADDIALEANTDAEDIDAGPESSDDNEEADEADALEEAQEDAAEERKEGGYQ
jgi:hypothetical protein